PFRYLRRQIRRRRLKRPVVDNTAAERRVLPVNIKSGAQGSCSFVDALSVNLHDRCNTRGGRSAMPVLVNKIRSSPAQRLASSWSGIPPLAMTVSYPAARNHRPRPCSISSHKNRGTNEVLSLLMPGIAPYLFGPARALHVGECR